MLSNICFAVQRAHDYVSTITALQQLLVIYKAYDYPEAAPLQFNLLKMCCERRAKPELLWVVQVKYEKRIFEISIICNFTCFSF
jgi:hypothetical protein